MRVSAEFDRDQYRTKKACKAARIPGYWIAQKHAAASSMFVPTSTLFQRLILVPLQNPISVIALLERDQHLPELFDGVEVLHP